MYICDHFLLDDILEGYIVQGKSSVSPLFEFWGRFEFGGGFLRVLLFALFFNA